jgi:D-alanine-D-alanine ligase
VALRVLHLVGSAVSDFFCDLSRLYARDCLAATDDPGRYEPVIAYVTPGGRWQFPGDLSTTAIAEAPVLQAANAVARIVELRPDVMVPQMFCLPGMTSYRALFDLLDIPYVGNPPDVMALAGHKARAKAVVAAAGVAVPRGEVVGQGERPTIEPPAVVKPIDADNSLGVTFIRDHDGFDAAIDRACAHSAGHSDAALVEEYIELGREVRCGIVVRDGELTCLPLEEYRVDPRHKPIRDADDKLARDPDGELALVAKERTRAWILDPDDPITTAVWDAARRCHIALGCRDYSLFDFRVDPDGHPWFLEAGLYCSFARQSVIPTMAAAAGIGLDELFASALDGALTAHAVPDLSRS